MVCGGPSHEQKKYFWGFEMATNPKYQIDGFIWDRN